MIAIPIFDRDTGFGLQTCFALPGNFKRVLELPDWPSEVQV